MAAMKGRRGGARKGAGRTPLERDEIRRNRVVMLLTDAEHEGLKAAADKAGKAIGTAAREIVVRSVLRAR